jgi:hypothetical protein
MLIRDAKELIGKQAAIMWVDRRGVKRSEVLWVYGVHFEPMYGHYLETDEGEILVDHIQMCRLGASSTEGQQTPKRARSPKLSNSP